MYPISAEHDRGIYDLWEAIDQRLPPAEELPEEEDDEIRIAVIGRPNIGKSTLVNRLVGEDRHVVHDMPGTTMDSVDSVFEHNGQKYRIVDTAGIRRRAKINDSLEIYAVLRAIKTIERCHITLLLVDATEGVSKQDARLAALVSARGRGCVLLMNKWDLVKNDPDRNSAVVTDEIHQSLPHLSWAHVVFISALTGKGCHRILNQVGVVFESFDTRIPTSKLNRFLEQTVGANPPPQKHHHPVRLNYMTQARVRPPTFIIWTNSPDAVKAPYRRFLENRLREAYGFEGTPVRIWIRKKRKPGEPRNEV
jgi:GTP-binding protein